jgi:hypothetical protein
MITIQQLKRLLVKHVKSLTLGNFYGSITLSFRKGKLITTEYKVTEAE